MASKPETVFRNRITPKLKALPHTQLFSIQQVGINGTPDILACINGVFVAIELKASEAAKPSKLQAHFLQRVQACGGVALLIHPQNWEESYGILQTLAQSKGPTT